MNGFSAHALLEGFAVSFLNAGHFVVAYCVQLVVSHRGGFSVELVQADGLVCVFQSSDVKRISAVIYQYFRVAADFGKVDNVIFHILVIRADAVVPAQCLGGSSERLNHFARPNFGEHTFMEGVCRHEAASGQSDAVSHQCTNGRRTAHGARNSGTHCAVYADAYKHHAQHTKNFCNCFH